MLTSSVTTFLLALGGAHAQLQYGNNERVTTKDSEAVAAAFPEIEGFELLSPAFLRPDSTPPGWENGTAGPTSLAEMGKTTIQHAASAYLTYLTYRRLLLPDNRGASGLAFIPSR